MRLHKIAVTIAAFAAFTGSLVSSGLAQSNTQRARPPERTEAKEFSAAIKEERFTLWASVFAALAFYLIFLAIHVEGVKSVPTLKTGFIILGAICFIGSLVVVLTSSLPKKIRVMLF